MKTRQRQRMGSKLLLLSLMATALLLTGGVRSQDSSRPEDIDRLIKEFTRSTGESLGEQFVMEEEEEEDEFELK